MHELIKVTANNTITSLELVKQINLFRAEIEGKAELAHSDLLKIIRDEFSEEIGLGEISESSYLNSQNKAHPMFELTLAQAKQVLTRESKLVRKAVWAYIEKLEAALKLKIPQTFAEALQLAADQAKSIEKLEAEKQELVPKADYFDALVDRNLLTNFRDTAKEFSLGQKEFVNWLIAKKYIFRDKQGGIRPYMPHVQSGLFEIKEWQSKDINKAGLQTLITPRGRETFRLLLGIGKENLT